MVWVKLADDMPDHPKILQAGPLAAWMFICSLAWSNRYLTDGLIPRAKVRRLADVDDPAALADRLVEVGLWERVEGGFMIHDYLDYQRSAEDLRIDREQTAERVLRWRERNAVRNGASNASRNDVGNTVDNGVRTAAPYPYPDPYPDPVPDPTDASPRPPPQAEGEAPRTPRGRRTRKRRGELPTDGNAYVAGYSSVINH